MDPRARSAIEDFGRLLGLVPRFDAAGRSAFEFSDSGVLTFGEAERGTDLVVSLSFDVSSVAQAGRTLLARSGYDAASRRVLAVAASGDRRLVLAVRQPIGGINVQALVACFEYLKERKQAVR